MDRSKGRTLSLRRAPIKTDAPKLRNKLQKRFAKYRHMGATATVSDTEASATATAAIKDRSIRATTRHDRDIDLDHVSPISPTHQVAPPDLSDAKWSEYLRSSGCVYQAMQSWPGHCNESPGGPVGIIPEFSHLAISDDKAQFLVDGARAERERYRSPSDSSSTCVSSSPPSPMAPRTAPMRRRAKTPIFSIGQLDNIPRPRNAPSHRERPEKTSSVELIAEQYRALLESRNSPMHMSTNFCSDSHSEPPPSRLEDRVVHFGLEDLRGTQDNHDSITSRLLEAFRNEERPSTPPRRDPRRSLFRHSAQSPTSEDGTLVSFEEDTIYFKPVSFSPEPISPRSFPEEQPHPDPHLAPLALQGSRHSRQPSWPPPPSAPPAGRHHRHCRNAPSPCPSPPSLAPSSPPPDNLSLQICLYLLARDLACAITDRPGHQRPSPDVSALQVWVMIEAYERLRDHVVLSPPRAAEEEGEESITASETPRQPPTGQGAPPLQAMFDMWLRALYALHDSLSEEARAGKGEGEEEDVGKEVEQELDLPVEELD